MNRESITGYLGMSRDVARLENHINIQVGSLYYAPDIGFDMMYWLSPDIVLNAESFNIWLISQAARKQIMIIDSQASVEDFILRLEYTLAGNSELNVVRVEV